MFLRRQPAMHTTRLVHVVLATSTMTPPQRAPTNRLLLALLKFRSQFYTVHHILHYMHILFHFSLVHTIKITRPICARYN